MRIDRQEEKQEMAKIKHLLYYTIPNGSIINPTKNKKQSHINFR